MTDSKSDIYIDMVNAWEKKKADGLSPGQKALFYEKALQVVVERALQTLSGITLMVVLDRVLHQSKDKFPILSEVKVEDNSFNFNELLGGDANHSSEDSLRALRYLLAEFLRVLGRITADILTAPLQEELLQMTWKTSEKE